MFPICNKEGEVIAFSGRVLEADAKGAKYVNSPETPLFTKGNVLFGLHKSMRSLIDRKTAIVCEGQIDLISLYEGGVTNVIASQGTAFTDRQARLLKRYVEEVVLCFDSDNAGEKAAEKSLELLLNENLSVRVAAMPKGEDPDSLIRRDGSAAFQERIAQAQDFFAFQLDRLSQTPEFQTPRGRANVAHKLAGWVSFIKDAALREAVMGSVTARLELSMRQFQKMLERAPKSRADSVIEVAPEYLATPLTDPICRLLAVAALHDADACAWLRAAPYRELLAREEDASLVVKILESDYQPGDRGSQNAFLTSLSAEDESTITELLSEKPPAHAEIQASDCWNALVRRQITQHMEAIQARLRTPGLPLEETLRLQKENLDLRASLKEIARPLSPPLS
jgi:DNA primase